MKNYAWHKLDIQVNLKIAILGVIQTIKMRRENFPVRRHYKGFY